MRGAKPGDCDDTFMTDTFMTSRRGRQNASRTTPRSRVSAFAHAVIPVGASAEILTVGAADCSASRPGDFETELRQLSNVA